MRDSFTVAHREVGTSPVRLVFQAVDMRHGNHKLGAHSVRFQVELVPQHLQELTVKFAFGVREAAMELPPQARTTTKLHSQSGLDPGPFYNKLL